MEQCHPYSFWSLKPPRPTITKQLLQGVKARKWEFTASEEFQRNCSTGDCGTENEVRLGKQKNNSTHLSKSTGKKLMEIVLCPSQTARYEKHAIHAPLGGLGPKFLPRAEKS